MRNLCIGSPLCGAVNNFYQGTPELTVGVLDSVICVAMPVSIAATSSAPIAALAHATALSFVISAYAVNDPESASASFTEP